MQRARQIDSMQGFMASFRQFEKKLDKLQDDVNFHGHTLSELRGMVSNLSAAIGAEIHEDLKRMPRRTVATQYDERFHLEGSRQRRKNAIQPLINQLKAKSLQDQKYGLKATAESPFYMQKMSTPLVGKIKKTRKSDALRKSTFRTQKAEKNRGKVCKWLLFNNLVEVVDSWSSLQNIRFAKVYYCSQNNYLY